VRCEHTSNSLADVSEGLTSRMPRIGGSSSHRQTVSSARAAALEADEADEADEGGWCISVYGALAGVRDPRGLDGGSPSCSV